MTANQQGMASRYRLICYVIAKDIALGTQRQTKDKDSKPEPWRLLSITYFQ
jgi:hypothetical protein